MRNKLMIQPLEEKEIKIYAYTLPEVPNHDGYIKVGDTERDVATRIKEQTNTAGLNPHLLWSKLAQKVDGTWFRDKELHSFFRLRGIKRENFGSTANEWFYFNDTPEQAEELTDQFIRQDYSRAQIAPREVDYRLREEQEAAVRKTLNYFNSDPEDPEFLWNAKPRFGKTLTSYDLVRRMHAKNTLIVTNRPAIANSWFDDFNQFIAWQEPNMKFISETEALQGRAMTREQFVDYSFSSDKARQIVFISLQDLKGAAFAGGPYDKLDWVGKLNWDLLIIDEAHEGVDTLKTDRAFEALNRRFTLHLSGTPFKALADNKFSKEQIYNWSYVDEQSAKENWPNENTDSNPYGNLPELNLFTYQMSAMVEEEITQGKQITQDQNMDYAFDLNEFFRTDDKGHFVYESDVVRFLDNLSSGKYPFSEDEYKKDLNHTLWLLPRVASAKRLEYLLNQHPVFKDYHTVLAAGDGISLESQTVDSDLLQAAQDTKANAKSYDRVKEAIAQYERTITLSVGQLTTGVTIPEWTAVMMLSQIKSPALYFQAAFRAQNPYTYDKDGKHYQKERAYIFDFAPERTLELYDHLAVNLSAESDKYTEKERQERITRLLNFFPVIGEDTDGSMKELDTGDVLTIPNRIKSTEVVRQGFMSNLLFKNIGNIFSAPSVVREILGKIKPEKNKKHTDRRPVKDLKPMVDEDGEVDIPEKIVINQTGKIFGEKIVDTNRLSQDPKVNNVVRELHRQVKQAGAFDRMREEYGHTKKDTKKIEDQFKESLTDIVEKEYQTLQTTVTQISADYKTKSDQIEKDIEAKLALTFDDEEVGIVMEEAEQSRQAVQKAYQEATEQAQTAYEYSLRERVEELSRETVYTQMEKVENGKKRDEENDVRDHLRGFTRTIPAFLMAYGNENTRLANFEKYIDPDTFLELTSITIDDFKRLRDGFWYEDDQGEARHFDGFFNESVFNVAIKTFFDKKKELGNYFDESLDEDIFDYIPPQKTNQIYTPREVVEMMVDKLEEENPHIFENPNLTFIDLYTKSGFYLTELIKRLDKGLVAVIPDQEERIQHIVKNQVYGIAPSNIIYHIVKNYVLGMDLPVDQHHIYECDLAQSATDGTFKEDLSKVLGGQDVKFDVVIGNPPYQIEGKSSRAEPIYNYFMEESYRIADKVILITPGRFLFNVGQTPTSWNKKMLADPHLKVIFFEQDSSKVFSNTDIKGGIAVTYHDKDRYFGSIDLFIPEPILRSIYKKVAVERDIVGLNEIIYSSMSYKFSKKLFADYPEEAERLSGNTIRTNAFDAINIIFYDDVPDDKYEYVKVFGRQAGQRVVKYTRYEYVEMHDNLKKYKICVPKANGSGAIGEVLSTPIIGTPMMAHTQTFISIGALETREEAEAVLKYVKSKFSRAMLGTLKITQDNPPSTWRNVPLQDFTSDSDIDWSKSISEIDQQLYAKYGLTDEEIDFIETHVQPMA